MAASFGDMKTRIANELHRSDLETNSHITNAIKSAIKHFERERWYFNEATTSTSLTTSAGLATYALPADFMKIDSLKITVIGWKSDVEPMPYNEMDARDAGNSATRGPSKWYAVYGELLRLYPVPDGTYAQTLSYQKRLTTLSASADTNAWVDDLEELIRKKAKEIICRDVILDFEQADRITANIEQIVYPKMRTENDERLMSGRLTSHSV